MTSTAMKSRAYSASRAEILYPVCQRMEIRLIPELVYSLNFYLHLDLIVS